MDEPFFKFANKHISSSRDCPSFNSKMLNGHHSDFQNDLGEQLIFAYERATHTGTVYHGDLGWEHPQPVEKGGRCPSVVLDEAEMLWLRACWLAATAFGRHRSE